MAVHRNLHNMMKQNLYRRGGRAGRRYHKGGLWPGHPHPHRPMPRLPKPNRGRWNKPTDFGNKPCGHDEYGNNIYDVVPGWPDEPIPPIHIDPAGPTYARGGGMNDRAEFIDWCCRNGRSCCRGLHR